MAFRPAARTVRKGELPPTAVTAKGRPEDLLRAGDYFDKTAPYAQHTQALIRIWREHQGRLEALSEAFPPKSEERWQALRNNTNRTYVEEINPILQAVAACTRVSDASWISMLNNFNVECSTRARKAGGLPPPLDWDVRTLLCVGKRPAPTSSKKTSGLVRRRRSLRVKDSAVSSEETSPPRRRSLRQRDIPAEPPKRRRSLRVR